MRRELQIFIVTVFSIGLATGCAQQRQSLYSSWGEQLSVANQNIEDISMMLGASPIKCEPIEPKPNIGIALNLVGVPTIISIDRNGAASKAGIRPNQTVTRINGKSVESSKEVINIIREEAQWGEELAVDTTSGKYVLKLVKPNEAKQCYWDIIAGSIVSSGGGAYVNQDVGFASHSGSAYQRYFRASCRFYDGISVNCQSNWQE